MISSKSMKYRGRWNKFNKEWKHRLKSFINNSIEIQLYQGNMNRFYLDEDRLNDPEMSSDASLQTDEINHRDRHLTTKDLSSQFSLYTQQIRKELNRLLSSIARDFYNRISIFLDDEAYENEQNKLSKLDVVLKNWRPKLEIFQQKFNDLKTHMPYISTDKKKPKFPQSRKTRFLETIDKFLSKTQINNSPRLKDKNQTASKVQYQHQLNIVQNLYDQGRFQEAITKSKQALRGKNYPQLNFVLGNSFKALGFYKQAITEYDKAIKTIPRGCYYNNRGNCHLCLQDIFKAEQDYRKAIEYEPANQVFLGNYGNVCLTLKNFEEAIKVYNKALKVGPQNDFFYNNRAFAEIKLKRLDDAIESYNQAIFLSPLNHVYLKNRANLFMEKGMTEQAITDINEAIDIEPNKHQYYFLKGKWEYLAGLSQEAMMSFRRACELEPSKKTYKDYYMAIRADLGYR